VAEAAVKDTTQCFIRSAAHPIDRRFRARKIALKYNALFISDFGFGKFLKK
jgi:hypothetical protein